MPHLNTGWKHWDKYLSKFVGKKINCLELGSYKGDATSWMLTNLCTNPLSKVYSVDAWEGSPEYINVEFSEIEKIFDENVKKTGRSNQNVKMKMYTDKALIILKEDNIYFDFIFIDASHEAKDVLKDAILSWDILNENGILIFDDYKWDKLNKDYFCPGIAIDSFVHIYSPQIIVLYKGYQYIIEKKLKKHIEKPQLSKYYKLMEDITALPHCDFLQKLDDTIGNLEYSLKLSNKEPEYKETFGYNNKYLTVMNKDNLEDNNKYYNYDPNRLLLFYKDFDIIYKSLSEEIKKQMKKYNYNPYEDLKKLYMYMGKNVENPVYEVIMQIKLNDMIKIKNKSLSFLNFSHSSIHNNKAISDFIKTKFDLTDIKYMDVNYLSDTQLYNYNEIEKLTKKLDSKIDIIMISLTSINLINNIKRMDYEKYYTTQLFNSILFALMNQEINGCFVSVSFTFMTQATVDLLTIIKKYYKYVYLSCYNSSKSITTSTKIIASHFMGISKKELDELIHISKTISSKISKYDDYSNKSSDRFIHSLIKNNTNTKFIEKINNYTEEKLNQIAKINEIWQRLILELKNDKYKEQKIKNFIYTIQIKNVFWWLSKYKIFEII
jgi:hypothetical protein